VKTVLLLRHGKSKRGPQYATDFERPLAKRGKRDAERVGAFLADRDCLPDLILSSPAERARDTALRCADAADYQRELRFLDVLYFTGEETYLELLWELEDTVGSVMFVGHNPTTESAIETLCGVHTRMPTAAVARIDFAIERWQELDEEEGRLAWVQFPRDL
jgi:phosphohistidine phosphatase